MAIREMLDVRKIWINVATLLSMKCGLYNVKICKCALLQLNNGRCVCWDNKFHAYITWW